MRTVIGKDNIFVSVARLWLIKHSIPDQKPMFTQILGHTQSNITEHTGINAL